MHAALAEVPSILLEAARALMPIDPGLARETLLDAFRASSYAGASAPGVGAREVATAATRTATGSGPGDATADLLLDGFSRCSEAEVLPRLLKIDQGNSRSTAETEAAPLGGAASESRYSARVLSGRARLR